jgi:hypothetical protein
LQKGKICAILELSNCKTINRRTFDDEKTDDVRFGDCGDVQFYNPAFFLRQEKPASSSGREG